ncbi:MAG: hypothetical protein ACUVTM_05210 [Candidatus Bathyarchaeia archaeon]
MVRLGPSILKILLATVSGIMLVTSTLSLQTMQIQTIPARLTSPGGEAYGETFKEGVSAVAYMPLIVGFLVALSTYWVLVRRLFRDDSVKLLEG